MSSEKSSTIPVLAVIFDLDGTLIDSYDAHVESFRRALSRFGLTVEDEEIHRRLASLQNKLLKRFSLKINTDISMTS